MLMDRDNGSTVTPQVRFTVLGVYYLLWNRPPIQLPSVLLYLIWLCHYCSSMHILPGRKVLYSKQGLLMAETAGDSFILVSLYSTFQHQGTVRELISSNMIFQCCVINVYNITYRVMPPTPGRQPRAMIHSQYSLRASGSSLANN